MEDLDQWLALRHQVYAQSPTEIKAFWATFPWHGNTWVTGCDKTVLSMASYSFIRISRLGELGLRRISPNCYQFRKPFDSERSMSQALIRKLAIWLRIIIANYAPDAIGLWGPTMDGTGGFQRNRSSDEYEWSVNSSGGMVGRSISQKWTRPYPRPDEVDTLYARTNGWNEPIIFAVSTGSDQGGADLAVLQALDGNQAISLTSHPCTIHGPLLEGKFSGQH